ncbi:MAG: G1 family glutamic endopeptidase [Terriglobales bacterium]
MSKAIAVATLTVLVVSLSTFVAAENDAARAIYDQSATVKTNIDGIRAFPAPPAGFNAISASDEALAGYGFPPRPDKQTDAAGYAKWAKAMTASKTRWNGELKHSGFYSQPARKAAAPASAISGAPSTGYYYNWSGYINTNTLTKYNTKTSFYVIWSEFNVPVVNQSPDTCDGGWDLQVSWNGIDGNQDGNALLQGGSLSGAYCSDEGSSTSYYAWVEWFPAYDIIFEFYVNPGDDMYVETWDTSATQGYVYLVDETLGIAGVFGLTPNGGPGLIGNSAEYIVERPCCRAGHDYPLADYVWDFWAGSYAYNFVDYDEDKKTSYYPGSQSSSNIRAFMVNDQDSETISSPTYQGDYGIFFEAENCTVASGGCTP